MAFASLTIDLNARLANIEKDLGKSVHLAEASAQKMQTAFAGVGKAFAALGLIGAGGGFASMLKGLVDAADNLNDLNKATGVTVENLAGLQLVAENSGTNLDGLAQGVNKLNKYIGEASLGNAEAQSTLASLGVTAKDPMEAFFQLADAFGRFRDEGERSAVMSKVLGKSWTELAPALSEGGTGLRAMVAEGRALNPITQQMAEQADKFNDALGRFKISVSGAGTAIVMDLLPALTDMAREADAGIKAFGSTGAALEIGLRNPFKTAGEHINELLEKRRELEKEKSGIAPTSISHILVAGIDEDIAKLNKFLAYYRDIQSGEAMDLNAKFGTGDYKQPKIEIKKPISIFNESEAEKLQATLRKAFDIKPLDDFIASFGDRANKIKQEYAKLTLDIGPAREGPATATDTLIDIGNARGAFASGDTLKATALVDRAKSGLKDLASFEQSYYARQLQEFELSMNTAAQTTAEKTRSAMLEQLNAAAAEVAKMDPLHIPIAADAIAQDVRATLDVIRKELANDPLMVPVVATRSSGIYGVDSISAAALKVGAR